VREDAQVPITVVLNGTSSSGKTSIAEALRTLLPTLQISGIDTFLALQPPSMFSLADQVEPSEGFTWKPAEVDGVACWTITPGARGEAMARAMHQFWAACAAEGVDQVIDHVVMTAATAADLQQRLAPYRPLYVAVRCDLGIAEQRERNRGDRIVGTARGQSAHIHDYLQYDLEIDTSRTSPKDVAKLIIDRLARDVRR
jgi:chloramphenicol 3-O phosphotransferase